MSDTKSVNVYIDPNVECEETLRDGKSWKTAFKSIAEAQLNV